MTIAVKTYCFLTSFLIKELGSEKFQILAYIETSDLSSFMRVKYALIYNSELKQSCIS